MDESTKDQSPFRCTVPDRLKSALISVGGFSIAAASSFVPKVGWIISVLSTPFALLFLLAALVPGKFLEGVAVAEEGFEFRKPLRTPKFFAFSAIDRIDAFCRGDGDRGDDVHFMVKSEAAEVLIPEYMLIRSGLMKVLKALPHFDKDAYRQALNYEPHGMDFLFGKRITIYEKMGPQPAKTATSGET